MAKLCPNCLKEKKGKFCDACGVELTEKPSADTNQTFRVSGTTPCPGCGHELEHGHQRFCPGCGHRLVWTCR